MRHKSPVVPGLFPLCFNPVSPLGVCTMRVSKDELEAEALSRATSGQSLTNWPAIFSGFTAKGIPENDILPRVNVLTYHAWRAKGRQVRRGEHGVKVTTWVSPRDKAEGSGESED